jgi:hypothetical protein
VPAPCVELHPSALSAHRATSTRDVCVVLRAPYAVRDELPQFSATAP